MILGDPIDLSSVLLSQVGPWEGVLLIPITLMQFKAVTP